MVRALTAALAATVLVLTAGCGDGEDDVSTTSASDPATSASADPTPAETAVEPSPAPLPACSSVWPKRTTLPEEYAGCRENGVPAGRSVRCSTGQQLHTYAGRYFGVPGGPIFTADGALADDPRFQKMERVCTA